jgi:hypothetical protein
VITLLFSLTLAGHIYAQGTVVFWNKMGSISELHNSEIGPGFDYTHGIKEFGPVLHGNGVEYDYSIGGAGAHLIAFTEIGPMTAGTIEYWYLSNTVEIDRETTYLPGIRDPFGNGIGVSLNWDSCYGERCGLSMNVTTALGKHSRIQTGTYGDANITFSTTEPTHLAFVWDSNGIGGTADTMRIYRDNHILLSSQPDLSDWDNTQTIYRVHGGGDWRSNWRTAPNGKIDNLKIWNYAKTDFSDRFIENPSTYFSDFTLKDVLIKFKKLSESDSYYIKGNFTLAENSDGIDPLKEDVNLKVGTSNLTIPAGSFSKKGWRKYKFKGRVGGIRGYMRITKFKSNSYYFMAWINGADLTGTPNPIPIGLSIGDDSGQTDTWLKGILKKFR